MASFMYKTDKFTGIDQSQEDSFLPAGAATDARNMNTDDGNLSVATGFSKVTMAAVPGSDTIHRCTLFRHGNGNIFIAAAGDSIYGGVLSTWVCLHTYSTPLTEHNFGFLEAKIGTKDYLIIGNGETQLLKFDGQEITTFGSSELCSDRPVRYLAMYKNRLFSAGDKDYPNRLYWSKLPGDSRSIEDWGSGEESVNVNGGHTEIGVFDNDPIVALVPLSSQLLILKKNSIYRLYGDKPDRFTVEEIETVTENMAHTSIVHYGDVAFFLAKSGLYVFDGVGAHVTKDANKIKRIMKSADVSGTKAARVKDKLYFTITLSNAPAIIEYDLTRQTYMLRDGFSCDDIFAYDNSLYIVRYVCRFDDSDTYAGEPIHAYWNTPVTDLGEKSVIKQLCELYIRGDDERGDEFMLTTKTGGITRDYLIRLCGGEVTEVQLCDEGRAFGLVFCNVAGKGFSLLGGTELRLNMRGRCV